MSAVKCLLLAMLWVSALRLRAAAHGLTTELAAWTHLRRALTEAPGLAIGAHCAKPAGPPCARRLLWWHDGAFRDVCVGDAGGPPPAALAVRRRYALTLSCSLEVGGIHLALPLVAAELQR